jgi:hypothetical protein
MTKEKRDRAAKYESNQCRQPRHSSGRVSVLSSRRGARRRNPAWAHGCLRQCSHQPARQQKEAAIVASNLPLSIPATNLRVLQ